MNKALLAIVVVQAVLVGALVYRFGALQSQTDRMEQAMALYMSAESGDRRIAAAPAPAGGSNALSQESYEALRVIVREEIDRLADEINSAPPARSAAASTPVKEAPPVSPAESARLYEDFQNDLNSYRAKGSINSRDMTMLEQKIAKMPPAERTRALSALSKAMSDGTVDAKL